jgi:hypothetical protein
MKKNLLALICFTLIFACKGESSNPMITATKNSTSKIENFYCATFFETGDYSSICFIDGKSPLYNKRNCIYGFVTKGDKHYEDIKIQFTDKNSTSLAEMHLNLNKNNYKKGDIKEVSNLGDAAFFDTHSTDLKSLSRSNKDLHVRHKNITFSIMATYQSNTKTPFFIGTMS